MFTGIITHLGILQKRKENYFKFEAPRSLLQEVKNGSSIAVNGTCLTVVRSDTGTFTVELMPETIKKTMFTHLQTNDVVNLELPLPGNGRFDGHIVQGHVDGVGKILKIEKDKNGWIFHFAIPNGLDRYIVAKGSIAVNGISLTVIDANTESFTVGIIPYTREHTMLHTVNREALVNIETDILAKYIEKLVRR